MRILALILISSFLLVGCGGFQSSSSRQTVWAPWPDSSGVYKWQEVPLLTRSNPIDLDSAVARIFWRSSGGGTAGFRGSVVRPHLIRSSNKWLATDTESLVTTTAFLIIERLSLFDQKMGIAQMLSWPRAVGVDIGARTVTRSILNNALYDETSDSIVIVPYLGERLPPSMNQGILAHEHFHAYFARALKWAGLENYFSEARLFSQLELSNIAILSSWNEGLADFYASQFSRDPVFVGRSFLELQFSRDLRGEISALAEVATVRSKFNCQDQCSRNDLERYDPYVDGQKMARFLYFWSQELSNQNRDKLLRDIVLNQAEILRRIQGLRVDGAIQPQDWLNQFMQVTSVVRSQQVCQKAKILLRFSDLQQVSGCSP